jgi:hypothetical protein
MHTVHTTSDRSTTSTGRFAARCLVTTAVVAASISATSTPTSAAEPEGCGAAWTLLDVDELILFIRAANPALNEFRDDTFDAAVREIFSMANRNGYDGDELVDGYVCVRTNKGNAGQDRFYLDPTWPDLAGHYVITNINDNNSRTL